MNGVMGAVFFISVFAYAYNVQSIFDTEGILKAYIEERVLEAANYIIENKATVRQCAKQFGISKSTVHKDVSERLSQINSSLASEVRSVLDKNKKERHIRGGMATKAKYLKNKTTIYR